MAIRGFITIALDDTSLSAIKYFSQFPNELKTVITYAIEDGAEIVAQAAEGDTWTAFKNPTGNLAGNIFSATNALKFQVKYSSGTVKNGSITLA